MSPTGEEEIVRKKAATVDPCGECFARLCSDLESDGTHGLALYDTGSWCNLSVMGNVSNTEANEVTGSQFTVDGKVEESQLADIACQLQPYPNSPYFFELERRLLADELATVPGGARDWILRVSFHGVLRFRDGREDKRRTSLVMRTLHQWNTHRVSGCFWLGLISFNE